MNFGESNAGELREILECRASPAGERVEIVSGGWMSGPSIDVEPEDFPTREYGLNIVMFMHDYPEFVILGGKGGQGWTAYTRGQRSRAVGPGTNAASLDELAMLLNRVRRRLDGV